MARIRRRTCDECQDSQEGLNRSVIFDCPQDPIENVEWRADCQHPNTVWQLRMPDHRVGMERAMTNWIANTFRLTFVPQNESWGQKHAEVRSAIVELVQGVVGGD